MKILLTTLNAKYIHKNLALRWLYVASPLKDETIIKEYTIKEDLNNIADEIIMMNVDVVAFSTYIWNIEETMELVKKIKKNSKIRVILGGPEVSYDSFSLIEQGVDALSLGEGEVAFWQYIDMIRNQDDYEITSIYTKNHPNKIIGRVDLTMNETYENPYFLPFDEADNATRYFYLETSRGCPYSCEYCLSSTDNKVRFFSESYIFNILEKIANSQIKIVKLLDRTFNVHPKRALKIARYMNEYCTNQIFQFEVVAETLSEEMLNFFCDEADKNRFRLEIGVQSFHEQTLKAVGRIQNNERLIEVITRLQKANVTMHVDLIAGLPYEGLDLFKTSFNRLYELHVSEIQLGILKLLKGTKLTQKQEEYEYVFNAFTPYDVLSTKWLNKKELEAIGRSANAVEKFYNNGRARTSIDTIIELQLYPDAFTLFYDLGKQMKSLKKPYQPWNLFSLLKQLLKDQDEKLVDGIINYDYYRLFKQKPKMFLQDKLNQQIRREISEEFLRKGIINEFEMYHYTHIDTIYYQNTFGIQVILYSNKQTYPRRFFYQDGKIEEIL